MSRPIDYYKGDKMRKRIFSLCYQLGWVIYDEGKAKNVVDVKRLDSWMNERSIMHKPLGEYSYKELPALVTQFENMAISYLNKV